MNFLFLITGSFELLKPHCTAFFSVYDNEKAYLQGAFSISILASSTTWAKPSNAHHNYKPF